MFGVISTVVPRELGTALRRYRGPLIGIVWLSALLNILALSGSIYMMLVYDFVLPSRSVSTLLGLLVVVAAAYGFQMALEYIRTQLLGGVGAALALDLAPRAHRMIGRSALQGRSGGDAALAVRDLDQIRAFLSSGGPSALIDLPWVVLFIGILGFLHIWLGVTALAGAIIMIGLTIYTDHASKQPSREAGQLAASRQAAAEISYRFAEEIRALGMAGRVEAGWTQINKRYLHAQQQLGTLSTGLGGVARGFRIFLQSTVLTVGALLVIDGKVTAGIIFASSVLSARALSPIDQSISHWKNLTATRAAAERLGRALALVPDTVPPLDLPPPTQHLAVEGLTLVPPGAVQPSVADVSFTLKAGDGLVVVGPSASGKSSLARGLVGVWPAARGHVRLDGAALDQWSPDALGPHIGYLPQNVELMSGTVAQNIARFESGAPSERVIAAARSAGVHDMIVRLPGGYDTLVGQDGHSLSAGHRQRVALARALYGDPFLVVLDEPNSNLDAQGEEALIHAVAGVRARGGIAIVIAHRTGFGRGCRSALCDERLGLCAR